MRSLSSAILSASDVRAETGRVRRIWDEQAATYDHRMGAFERLLFAGGREWVCSRANGDVLEIAVGTGRNLPYYGENIRLTGIDVSPAMLAVARRRAETAGVPIALGAGDAQALDLPDERFDAVVFTLALCSIPDARRAVAEAKRVLRPGGRLLLLEHVRSPLLPVRLIQHLLDPLAVRLEGDHLVREPLEDLKAEGFEIKVLERSKLGIVERVSARRPAGPPSRNGHLGATANAPEQESAARSHDDRRLDRLRLLLTANIAASALHFADNAVFLPEYREPTWTPGPIAGAWVLITAVGILGYVLYRQPRRAAASSLLFAYGLMGLLGLTHYLTVPIWEFSARINTFILLEATAAAVLLATLLRWRVDRSQARAAVP